MSINITQFRHVSNLWNEAKAAELAGDEVALLIYRSNLLGSRFAANKLWRRQYIL